MIETAVALHTPESKAVFQETIQGTGSSGPFLEYIAATANGIVATEYLYGRLWKGRPGELKSVSTGGLFISCGGDGQHWAALDAEAGQIVSELETGIVTMPCNMARRARAIARSGDALWLGLQDCIVGISMRTGECTTSFPVSGVVALATSADGRRLAAARPEEHCVSVIDVREGLIEQISDLRRCPLRFPRGVAFDPAGRLWISDTENRRVGQADGRVLFSLAGRPGFPTGLAWTADQMHVAVPYEGLLLSLDAAQNQPTSYQDMFYPYALAWFEHQLWVSHPAAGEVRCDASNLTIRGFADPIGLAAWAGKLVVVERDASCLTLLDGEGRRVDRIDLPANCEPRAIVVTPDDQLLIAAQRPPRVVCIDASEHSRHIMDLDVPGIPRTLAWTSQAIALATSGYSGVIWLDAASGRVQEMTPLAEAPVCLASSADGLLATLDRRGELLTIRHEKGVLLEDGLVTPRGILAESSFIAVAESLAHRVRILERRS